MTRYIVIPIAALCLAACPPDLARDVEEQAFMSQQGTELHGLVLHGGQLQGTTTLQGFRFSGATLNGAPLVNLRLVRGELVAEQNRVALGGTALANARLFAEVQNRNVQPPETIVVEYEITGIAEEDPKYDPARTGATFLYTLTQNVDNTGSWRLACPVDSDGRSAAIPLADTWNERGDRVPSAQRFTFGCTTGAIGKCYRWGYRPWVTGYGNLATTHWTCTRVARADYCGDGESHTENGKLINLWDTLPSPGPILSQGPPAPRMIFEAAWNQHGALCLSHARWNFDGTVVAAACLNRLRPPGLLGAVCDTLAQALMLVGGPGRMYNEAAIGP